MWCWRKYHRDCTIYFPKWMERLFILIDEVMNRKKLQKTKGNIIPEQVDDKLLLKENMMKKQAEIEAVMKEQVGEGVEQSLKSAVKKEMFFDEEIQQDVIEPKIN